MKRGLMTYRYFIFRSLNKLFFLILLCFLGCDNGTAQRKVEKKSITTSKHTRTNKKVQKVNATMAPDFTLADLEGNWVSMNQFKGKVVLLNFWGTWCGPCRREIPDFVKLSVI